HRCRRILRQSPRHRAPTRARAYDYEIEFVTHASAPCLFSRHCEERSDEAIQTCCCVSGLLRFARNDEDTSRRIGWAKRSVPTIDFSQSDGGHGADAPLPTLRMRNVVTT